MLCTNQLPDGKKLMRKKPNGKWVSIEYQLLYLLIILKFCLFDTITSPEMACKNIKCIVVYQSGSVAHNACILAMHEVFTK
jgi:hypothetical protein